MKKNVNKTNLLLTLFFAWIISIPVATIWLALKGMDPDFQNIWGIYGFLLIFLGRYFVSGKVKINKSLNWTLIKNALLGVGVTLAMFFAYRFLKEDFKKEYSYIFATFFGCFIIVLIWLRGVNKIFKHFKEQKWEASREARHNAIINLRMLVTLNVGKTYYRELSPGEYKFGKESFEILKSWRYLSIHYLPDGNILLVLSKENLEKVKSKINFEQFLSKKGFSYRDREEYSEALFKDET